MDEPEQGSYKNLYPLRYPEVFIKRTSSFESLYRGERRIQVCDVDKCVIEEAVKDN